jgi:hypothetical protein
MPDDPGDPGTDAVAPAGVTGIPGPAVGRRRIRCPPLTIGIAVLVILLTHPGPANIDRYPVIMILSFAMGIQNT